MDVTDHLAPQIQRTPIINRTTGAPFGAQQNAGWVQPPLQTQGQQSQGRVNAQRQPFNLPGDRTFQSISLSDRSDSADEVENLLMSTRPPVRRPGDQSGWGATNQRPRPHQQRGILLLLLASACLSTDWLDSLCSNGHETDVGWIQTRLYSQTAIIRIVFSTSFSLASLL